jgi:hypothetical protein
MPADAQLAIRLSAQLSKAGCTITSPPGSWPLIVELAPDKPLPAELVGMGYLVQHCGQTTRLQHGGTVEIVTRGGKRIENRHAGFVPVAVYSISLPKT